MRHSFYFLRSTTRLKVVRNGRDMCKDRQVFTEKILAIFDISKPPGFEKQRWSLSLLLHHLMTWFISYLGLEHERALMHVTKDTLFLVISVIFY